MSKFKTTKARITHRLLEIEDEVMSNLGELDYTLIADPKSTNENSTKRINCLYIEYQAELKDTQENQVGVLSFIYEYENGYQLLDKEITQKREMTLIYPNGEKKVFPDLFHNQKEFEEKFEFCMQEIKQIFVDHYIRVINEPGVIDDEEGQLIDHYHEREMDKGLNGEY